MNPGQESQTAVMVCMGRAVAHGRTPVAAFADPTALALLPDEARERVERFRAGAGPGGLRGRLADLFLDTRSKAMVVRTVAIDDAIRAAPGPQVVILGAGLDGRAWRMAELGETTVFEVDHPDSQRQKQSRAAALQQVAGDVRFVAVDFARDDLNHALAAAGHDPARPTTWVWEGVVMYLDRTDIAATLDVVRRRSALRSRLVVAYHSPSPMLLIIGPLLRRVGEPLRSVFTARSMRVLLGKYGFAVRRDDDLTALAGKLSAGAARGTRGLRHHRIATADRIG